MARPASERVGGEQTFPTGQHGISLMGSRETGHQDAAGMLTSSDSDCLYGEPLRQNKYLLRTTIPKERPGGRGE